MPLPSTTATTRPTTDTLHCHLPVFVCADTIGHVSTLGHVVATKPNVVSLSCSPSNASLDTRLTMRWNYDPPPSPPTSAHVPYAWDRGPLCTGPNMLSSANSIYKSVLQTSPLWTVLRTWTTKTTTDCWTRHSTMPNYCSALTMTTSWLEWSMHSTVTDNSSSSRRRPLHRVSRIS